MSKVLDISDETITKCMHCGLCLPTCPTYVLTGLERSSPRGRIRLMKAVGDGDIGLSDEFINEMYFCLDCQACETACPAGVKYGSLVEAARDHIGTVKEHGLTTRFLKWALLRHFLGTKRGLKFGKRLLDVLQRSGLRPVIQRSKIFAIFSQQLQKAFDLLPDIHRQPSTALLSKKRQLQSEKSIKVGFLTGCVMDAVFSDVNADTISVLEFCGCEVVIPENQVCCGSIQAHSGDMATARRLAAQNVRAFRNLDAIVMNSAGCGAFMKQYGSVLADHKEMAQQAAEVASKVKDFSEFLVENGANPVAPSQNHLAGKRVTYHDACHLIHSQKISEQPRQLIKSVPNVEYVELPESSWCCGSAGIYNITHYETADQLLERKMANIRDVNPDIVVTSNPGCLLQLRLGLEREGSHAELLHLATFLRRACCE